MDSEGNVVAPHQGPRNIDGFRASGERVVALTALQKRAAEGDESAARELFFVRLDLGQLDPDEIREGSEAIADLSDEERGKIDSVLLNTEVEKGLSSIGRGRDPSKMAALGEGWVDAMKAGRVPSDLNLMMGFYEAIMSHAKLKGDAEIYAAAFQGAKDGLNADPMGKRFLGGSRGKSFQQQKENELEALRSREQ